MVVVCFGPVCIPLYGLVPVLIVILKPIWNALPLPTQNFIRNTWRTIERTPFLLVLLISSCVAVAVLTCYWTIENKMLFALTTVGTVASAGNYTNVCFIPHGRWFVRTHTSFLVIISKLHHKLQAIFCTANCLESTSWPHQKASGKWRRWYKPM